MAPTTTHKAIQFSATELGGKIGYILSQKKGWEKGINKACLAYLYFSLTYSYCFALRENRYLALNSLTKSSLLTISVKIYPYLSLFIFEEEFLSCMPNIFKINNKIN